MPEVQAIADVHALLRLSEQSPAWAILRAQNAPVMLAADAPTPSSPVP